MCVSLIGFIALVTSIFNFLLGDIGADNKIEIEIAPNKWLEVNTLDLGGIDRIKLTFEWNKQQVSWTGDESIETLREMNGTLYMICFNRKNINKCHYKFYRLDRERLSFVTIPAKDFPRAIATKNVGYYWPEDVSAAGQDYFVSALDLERSLDVDSPYFYRLGTARIWSYLETGVFNKTITDDFLHEYVAKYRPIPLPTIFKETDVPLAIKVGDDFEPVRFWLVDHELLPSRRLQPSTATLSEFKIYRIFDSFILYTEMGFEIKDGKIAKIFLYEDYKDSRCYFKPQETNTRYRGTVDELIIYSSLSHVYKAYHHSDYRGNMKNIVREILKRNAKKENDSPFEKQQSHNSPDKQTTAQPID